MQCIEGRALANDDLIPKRKPRRRQEFNVSASKASFSDNGDLGLHAEDKTKKRHHSLCKNCAKPFNIKVLC
jgi:hypothetical protein